MQKKQWLHSLLALFVVFISFSAVGQSYENEEDLIKAANKHFSKGEYAQCVELFSQLVSNHPQNPNYNFKYGTCLLYTTEDKEQAIKFLKFSSSKSGVEPEAFFYYARSLHLNYQFDEAKIQYKKYKTLVKPKVSEKMGVQTFIKQCATGQKLIHDIKQIDVVSKKKVREAEFFRSYRLQAIKRNVIVKPDEFKTKEDKKANEYSLIVHNPMVEQIYVSSYNKKDGMGGKDIFKIQKMPDGTFSEPINLGPNVNTSEDEDYPYLHPSGKVLYFASKGRNSIGGYDIFRSELDTILNLWKPAVNVGFAVNSPDDDILYVSDMDENIAYFASARENRQGEITVYKILPNNDTDPLVIVKGEVVIKGGTQNKAKITIYNDVGEEISQLQSQERSGSFTMNLEETKTYTIGLTAPGKGEYKTTVEVPKKSEWPMISKRFILGADNKIEVIDNSEVLSSSAAKKKLLMESAKLNVNQEKDVEFNTKIEKKKKAASVEAPNTEGSIADGGSDAVSSEVEEASLVASAEEELAEVKTQKAATKKKIEGAYVVAQKKKIKSENLRDEIEQISEKLSEAYSESEKEELKKQLVQKQQELKENAAEAVAAVEFAQAKERELKVKEKEEQSAKEYLDAVNEAEGSNNSAASIAKLEASRDKLDKIQKEIEMIKEDDGSAKTLAKTDAARKKVADQELKYNTVRDDVADMKEEKQQLTEQAESTRNKGLKEELNLQISEIDEEMKNKVVEERVEKAKLEEFQSELAVLESTNGVFSEIDNEADDENLIGVSEEQKSSIQKDVKETEKAVFVATTPEPEVMASTEPTGVEKAKEDFAKADEIGKVTPEQQYNDEVKKATIAKEELRSIQDEIELLELSMAGEGTTRQKEEIQKKIDVLKVDEAKAIEDVKKYVSQAKAQEADLPANVKAANSSSSEELAKLDEEIKVIEEEVAQKSVEPSETIGEEVAVAEKEADTTPEVLNTEVIEFDPETVTEKEIDEIVQEGTGIREYDLPEYELESEQGKLSKKASDKKKEAAKLLAEASKEQIEYESKGNSGESEKAKKLREEAFEANAEASELQGEANEKEYISNRDELEREIFSSPDLTTDELKAQAKEVGDQWISASVRRKSANDSKDPVEKTRLINEANELESNALKAQKELAQAIETRKEIVAQEKKAAEEAEALKKEQEKLAVAESTATNTPEIEETPVVEPVAEETAISNPVEVVEQEGPKEPIEEQEVVAMQKVDPSTFDVKKPTQSALNESNQEGYGIERDADFAYGPSPKTKQLGDQAKKLESQAAKFYYDAQMLEKQAQENPDKASKLKKEAEKLMKRGRKVQEEANEKYQEVNAAELSYNKDEIQFALDNDDIVKKDSARLIVKNADKLFEQAQEIRKQAKKEKNPQALAEKINEAYQKELQAIEMQNYVLSGELDGEEVSDIEEEVIVSTQKEEVNEYTKKAAYLRAQADKETDERKKQALYAQARENQLAGNTARTKRMQDQLDADKAAYDGNKAIAITSRNQSNNNTPANKGYKYEMLADSLYMLADDLRVKASKNSNRVQQVGQIEEAKELMAEAREYQADAISKYQESKSAPDEPNFIAVFRQDAVKETLPEAEKLDVIVMADPDPEPEVNPEIQIEEEVTVPDPEPVTEPEPVIEPEPIVAIEQPVQEQEPEVQTELEVQPEPEPVVEEPTEIAVVDPEPEQEVNELPTQEVSEMPAATGPSAQESYDQLIKEANQVEMQEVARVERIEQLKRQSAINKQKSEDLLSRVDGLSDEQEIMKTLSQANSFRDQAEQQEVEAKNEETILKNNIAESEAKRREAQLILEGLNEQEQSDLLASSEGKNEERDKINDFLSGKEPEEEKKIFSDQQVNNFGVPTETTPEPVVDEPEERVEVPVVSSGVNLEGATILGPGETESQIQEEFVMNPSQTYSSSSVIPMDPEMPKGIIYQVQVGAFRNKIDPSIFNGLSPLVGEETQSGIIRYKVGYFRGFKSANMAKARIRQIGYRDAFVVVFFNGKRITIEEAEVVIENADESEKFVHENLVADEVSKLKKLGISEDIVNEDPTDVSASPVVVNPNTLAVSPNTVRNSTPSGDNGLNNDLLQVGGVFYTVQVGVFRTPRVSSDLYGVSPLYTEKIRNGLLRYTTGVFRDYPSANYRKGEVRSQGVSDAFVIAYNGQQKITAAQARELTGNESIDEASATNSGSNKQESSSTDNAEVVFKVQVGAYRAPITVESTPVFKDLTNYPISSIELSNGLLIYMAGNYKTKAEADNLRQTVVNLGGTDCFVVAVQNGKRIPMRTALELTGQ